MDNIAPYLCGGVVFTLLLQARKPRKKQRDRQYSGNDNLSETKTLSGLIAAVTGNEHDVYKETFKKNTSEYKMCKINGSIYIPFNDSAVISGYDDLIKNNYCVALERMSSFVEQYIDKNKIKWLVKVLLSIIKHDCVNEQGVFYVCSNGAYLTKYELQNCSSLEFQPFLVGIMHYVLTYRTDNKLGASVIRHWKDHPESITALFEEASADLCVNYYIINDKTKYNENHNLSDFNTLNGNINQQRNSGSDSHLAEPKNVITPYSSYEEFFSASTAAQHRYSGLRRQSHVNLSCDYFHLFVIGGENYKYEEFVVPKCCALTKNWLSDDLFDKYATLSTEAILQLKKYPAVFCNINTGYYGNTDSSQTALIGCITEIDVQDNGIKIYYNVRYEISQQKINMLAKQLNIRHGAAITEMNETHWTIKEGDLLAILQLTNSYGFISQ